MSDTGATETGDPDPIDEEAAEIDVRSVDAAEQVEDLVEHAQQMGRDADQPIDGDG